MVKALEKGTPVAEPVISTPETLEELTATYSEKGLADTHLSLQEFGPGKKCRQFHSINAAYQNGGSRS